MANRLIKLAFQHPVPYRLSAEAQFSELIYRTTLTPIHKVFKDNSSRNQCNGIARIIVQVYNENATKLTTKNNLEKLAREGLTLVEDINLTNLYTVSIYKPTQNIRQAIVQLSTPEVYIVDRKVKINKISAPTNSNRVFITFENAADAREASQLGCYISGYPAHKDKVTLANNTFVPQCKKCYMWNDHSTNNCKFEGTLCSRCTGLHHYSECRFKK